MNISSADALPSVLLAVPDPAVRPALAQGLRAAGYPVTELSDTSAALAALEQSHHPMLIADAATSGFDAAQFCREVRSRSFGGYVHIVLLGAPGTEEQNLSAGADDCLTTPVGEAELRARLHLGRRLLALQASLRDAKAAADRLAVLDTLTGTYNRRYLMQELPGEVERTRRFGRPLSVVMCDIDHLKQINDTWGSQVGDEVLREFAQHLTTGTRAGIDWCARHGGEEFLIVLPETDAEGAANLAEKLRAGVADLLVRAPDGSRVDFKASFGVAGGRRGVETADSPILLARADLALYQSKRDGRNRVTLRG